jgi:hypothetical protein
MISCPPNGWGGELVGLCMKNCDISAQDLLQSPNKRNSTMSIFLFGRLTSRETQPTTNLPLRPGPWRQPPPPPLLPPPLSARYQASPLPSSIAAMFAAPVATRSTVTAILECHQRLKGPLSAKIAGSGMEPAPALIQCRLALCAACGYWLDGDGHCEDQG